MIPVWFINTIADILHKQGSTIPVVPHIDTATNAPIETAKRLTLIQSTKSSDETIEKIDDSMPIRRIRRAVESQLVQEFGLGFMQKLSLISKQQLP